MPYWGISPPADCVAASASDAMLRFICSVELGELERFFRYYYPTLRVTPRPGGLALGGSAGVATGQAVALPGGARAQLLLHRPADGPRDEVAEALIRRLLAPPDAP